MSVTKNYLEPSEFFEEMLVCLNAGKVTERLGMMLTKLTEKNANHRYFVRYTHIREELISEGILICVEKFSKFRPLKNNEDGTVNVWNGDMLPYHYTTCNNPFAYFTRVIHNAFKAYLKRHEYYHRNIVNKMRAENDLPVDYGYAEMMSGDDHYDDDGRDGLVQESQELDQSIEEVLSSNSIGDAEDKELEEEFKDGIQW